MISFFRKLWRDKRGNALVIAAAALPLVIGSAGLASDTIQWALWKRQIQRAADSGAIAGVYSIVEGSGDRTGVSAAVTRDMSYNSHIKYTVTKTVGAPTSGTYATDAYAVQVQLAVQQKLGFSGMFLNYIPTITATSIATVVPSGQYCVVSLENQAVTGIDATGSTNVNLGCGMITNSTSMSAAVATGSSTIVASPIAAVGGIPASTHWGTGTVLQPFTVAQPDPFASVTAPVVSNGSPACANDPNVGPQGNVNLSPGCYKAFSVKGTANLSPGTYYIDGGSLDFKGTINCTGCTFVLSNSDPSASATIGGLSMNSTANLNISAPDTGNYAGILIYQDRRALSGNSIKINGDSSSHMQGAFYFPKADLTFNGNSGAVTTCLQIVAKDVTFTGNSSISNTCPANSGSHAFTGKKVRLVA